MTNDSGGSRRYNRIRSKGAAHTRHGRLASRGPVATAVRIALTSLAVLVVAAVAVSGLAIWQVASSVQSGIHLTDANGKTVAAPPDVGAIAGGVNLLLVGTDTRTGQGGAFSTQAELAGSSGAGSNDVTMLLHIAANHKSATVVSIPRDLEVPIPACPNSSGGTTPASSQAMFNTGLSRGGLNCVVLTTEAMTGLTIPYAAEISFDGVSQMSDAIGGVSVCIATPIVDPYTGLNLPAGEQTIVGQTALEFLRTRHGVGDGSDLGRISNQQVFMSALERKVTSGGVLSNPIQLYSLAKAAASNMTLSDSLTNPATLVSIAVAMKSIGLPNMVFLQYPATGDPSDPNRVIPLASAASQLDSALVADQPIQLSGAVGRAAVVAPPTAAPAPATGTGTATASPSPAAAPASNTVVLPPSVTGQTAAEDTCSKGNN
jgi:LCP family protein required for cell wall assembly